MTQPTVDPDDACGFQTTADFVRLLGPHCQAPYFSPEAYANVLARAAALPAALSLSHMFERPVGASSWPVDFLVWIPNGGRRDVLAGQSGDIPASYFTLDSWSRIRDFAQEWTSSVSPLYDVRSVWLEFDSGGRLDDIPIPLIFFTLDRERVLEPALDLLHGQSLRSPAFRACWAAIPPECPARTVGILYSRSTDTVRLIVLLTLDCAFQYLRDIRWPGDFALLEEQFAPFSGFHNEVALHIDVQPDGVSAQVGFEIYSDKDAMYKGRGADCRPLLDAAVAEQLCLPPIRDALIGWPGTDSVAISPTHSIKVERAFHHLKLVFNPATGLFAKAYTTADYEVIDDSDVRA